MAAERERFSIRDYATRMRIAVGPGKCWPFVGEENDNENPPLPPLSVRRYRWWADDLRSAADFRPENHVASRKGNNLELKEGEIASALPKSPVSPHKRSVVEDLQSPKGRTGTPKKIRSMVELFASSSRIELNGGDNNEMVKGQAESLLEEEKELRTRKRKWNGKKVGFKFIKKEKVCKPKMISLVPIHAHQEPTIQKKILVKKAIGGVESNEKFEEVKALPKKLPVRRILKNNKRFTSTRKSSRKMNKAKKAVIIKRNRRTTTHDTIYGKGDRLGGKDNPQFKSLSKIFADVLAQSSSMNNSSPSHELPPPVDTDQAARDESSSEKNQISIKHQTTKESCNSIVKAPLVLLVDLNHALETYNDFDSNNPSTKVLPPTSKDADFRGTAHKDRSSISTGIPQEAELLKKSNFTPSEKMFDSNPHPHISISCDLNLFCCIPKNQPGDTYLRSKRCKGSLALPNSFSTSKSNSKGDDFTGLCLNSQGDLAQIRPDMRFVELNKNKNMALGSSEVLSAHKHAHLNMNHLEIMSNTVFDDGSHQNDQSRNHYQPVKPRQELNFTEITGSGSLRTQNDKLINDEIGFLHSESNKTMCSLQDYAINDFFREVDPQGKCKLDRRVESVFQPTIQLMGKTVVVGGSSKDCFTDMRSWTTKDCKTGQSFSSIMSEKNFPKHWMQADAVANTPCGSSTSNLLNLSDSPPNFYLMLEREPRFDLHMDHGLQSLSINTDINMPPGNNVSEEAFFGAGHQYPTIAFYQKNIEQHMMSSSANSKHTSATYQPIIRYHDYTSLKPSPIQHPEKLPQWLLNAEYSKGSHLSSSPHSHPTVQTFTFPPNSSQSSPISAVTVTNSNSEDIINTGIV